MSLLTKDQFLQAPEPKREEVEVYGLGRTLMREMMVNERQGWQRRHRARKGKGGEDVDADLDLSLAMIAASLCVDGGGPMFAENEIAGAVEALKAKSQRTVEELQKHFLKINGMDPEALKEEVGNSGEIPSDGSSTSSPGISDTRPPRALQSA